MSDRWLEGPGKKFPKRLDPLAWREQIYAFIGIFFFACVFFIFAGEDLKAFFSFHDLARFSDFEPSEWFLLFVTGIFGVYLCWRSYLVAWHIRGYILFKKNHSSTVARVLDLWKKHHAQVRTHHGELSNITYHVQIEFKPKTIKTSADWKQLEAQINSNLFEHLRIGGEVSIQYATADWRILSIDEE